MHLLPDSASGYFRISRERALDLNSPNASIGSRSPARSAPPPPPPEREGPLPHSGLFKRRHSAFGTRLAGGVRELVEQGVLVDQERIRFDDFVAGRGDEIPGPGAGEAVAVSHGLAPVPAGTAAWPQATHFLEIALRAGDVTAKASDAQPDPPPLNVVFVVDTSSSMGEAQKLVNAKAAVLALYAHLRPDDVFGIVSFSHHVRTVLPATRVGALTDGAVERAVRSMQADGSTDLNQGILFGLAEAGRNTAQRPDLVSCVYLFTDGYPMSGERDWLKIRANAVAEARGSVTLSCFGFGADARMEELEALAGLTGGHCTLVTQPEEVTLNLAADLIRRDHLAAVNVQLKINVPEAFGVWHFYGHDLITDPVARAAVWRDADEARELGRRKFGADSAPDVITDKDGIRVFAPDLAAGETYWIVLELAMPDGKWKLPWGHRAVQPLTAVVQYVDTAVKQARRHEIMLSAAGQSTGQLPASTVAGHALGLRTSEVAFDALDDLRAGDLAGACTRLEWHAELLRTASRDLHAAGLADDQVTVRKLATLVAGHGQPRAHTDEPGPYPDELLPQGGEPVRLAAWALRDLAVARGGYDRHIGDMGNMRGVSFNGATFINAQGSVFNTMSGVAKNVVQGRSFRDGINIY
jgi:Mg-chelatase subunit ChlD